MFVKFATNAFRGYYPFLACATMSRPRVSIVQGCTRRLVMTESFQYSSQSRSTARRQHSVPPAINTREISDLEALKAIGVFICFIGLTLKFFSDYQCNTIQASEAEKRGEILERLGDEYALKNVQGLLRREGWCLIGCNNFWMYTGLIIVSE